MAGRDLFADEAPPASGGRDLFADEQPAPIQTQVVAPPVRPPMEELYQKFRTGQMSPGAGAAFQELAVRRMGAPIETRSINYAEPVVEDTLPPRQQAMKDLASETGWLESLGVSMGKGFGTVAKGLNLGPEFGEFGDAEDPIQKEAMAALETAHPVATTIGETLGEALPFVPAAMATGGMAATIPRVAATTGITALEGGSIQAGKGQDATTGALMGSAIGLGAEVIFPIIGKLGSKVFQRVMKKAPEGAMLDAAGKPTVELQQALEKSGLTYEDLVNDSFDALGSGSEKFDPDQLVRKQFLESQGITPTKAQVTRDATDFQAQQEAVKASSRARGAIENQEAVLTTRFNDAVTSTSGASSSPINIITEAVVDKATALDKNISSLYKAAREAAPGEKNVRFNKLTEALRKAAPSNRRTGGNIEAIVGDLQSKGILGKRFDIKGTIDVETAEDVRKLMNELYDPQNSFGNTVLRGLKEALDEDVFRSAGDDIYKQARKAKSDFEGELTRSKISKFDSRRQNLVRDILENRVDPDQFVDKVVFGKTWRPADLEQLKSYVGDAPDSPLNDLKAEVLEEIKSRSFIGPEDASGFKALSRDKLESTINKIGWKKLGVIFDEPEVKFLQDMLKVAKLREPVRGTALGKGPSAQAIAALEKKLKDVPLLGAIVNVVDFDAAGRAVLRSKPAKKIIDRGVVSKALPAPTAAGLTAASIEREKNE